MCEASNYVAILFAFPILDVSAQTNSIGNKSAAVHLIAYLFLVGDISVFSLQRSCGRNDVSSRHLGFQGSFHTEIRSEDGIYFRDSI